MDDVAKAARVSVTTVSHVLNGTRKVDLVVGGHGLAARK